MMKTNKGSIALLLSLVASPTYAQMTIVVQPDRVLIGAEYVPRDLDLPKVLAVPAGQTVELPADSTYDYAEWAGTLKVSRTHDTVLRVTTALGLPTGRLDIGTVADPIPCGVKVEIVFRDLPIDTARDPFQWGHGLVNFGKQTRVGCIKTPWVETTGGLLAGATTATLASAPSNWQVGDELLIPDTAPPTVANDAFVVRRETPLTIAAINGTTLTFSKPLDFAHNTITDPQGVAVLQPRIANLTRNIVLRSENPQGTRGHTADVGMGSTWDIRGNQFVQLGRTLNVPLNDTALPHIGTNQRGKYAQHHHHAGSSVGSADVGNAYLGNRSTTKWGLAVHGTSDVLVQDNVCQDFPGACYVTEDGYEVRNVFRHNFAAYAMGTSRPNFEFNGRDDLEKGCPGCDGNGFWLRSVLNIVDGNEAWNNFRGINFFNQQQVLGLYPSKPGGMPDTPNNNHQMLPISVKGNVTAANTIVGFEFWAVRRYPHQDLISAYNRKVQVMGVQSDGIDHWLKNPKLICQVGTQGSVGVHADMAYTGSLEVDGGEIRGCQRGIAAGGGVAFEIASNITLQNEINIDSFPQKATMTNVVHVPLANHPHQYMVMNNNNFYYDLDHIWQPDDPLPKVGVSVWVPSRGSQLVVKNWQGTGQDYLLFYLQQMEGNPAWYSAPNVHAWNCPVVGLTMLECWNRYGVSYAGDVLKEADAVQLDGLIAGRARKGLGVTYPPVPRFTITLPTLRAPALGPDDKDPVNTGYVRITGVLTGDPNAASDKGYASIDGTAPFDVFAQGGGSSRQDDRSFNYRLTTPGLHTIRTWRTKKDAPTVIMPETLFTAQFCIGPLSGCQIATPPPPPPPPPGMCGR